MCAESKVRPKALATLRRILRSGNSTLLQAGHAYSVEPGIYIGGKWGARLEDIVVATDAGPMPLNVADHHLMVVEA